MQRETKHKKYTKRLESHVYQTYSEQILSTSYAIFPLITTFSFQTLVTTLMSDM